MLDADAIRSRSVGSVDPHATLDPDQEHWRHLELGSALPHPWFDKQLARALGISRARLARPEPQGWREQAAAGFDVAATLAELRSSADPDPARVDLLERMLAADVAPRDWMIRALPIPPASERAKLEPAYAEVVARNRALHERWTAAAERALARALRRLFGPNSGQPSLGDRVLGPEDRLVLEAWVPGAIAGPVVPDPELALDQLGLPCPLADSFEGASELLVVIRGAPTCDAVTSLRPVAIAADDQALRVSPMLLAAMAERARLDACELELVVGRGHGLVGLGPIDTLFARPFAHGLLLPRSVALTVLAASLSESPDELGDRRIRARMLERVGWIAERRERALRLERAQRLVRASLDDLTREGTSLGYADLRDPLGDVDSAVAEHLAYLGKVRSDYDRGQMSHGELECRLTDERDRWVIARIWASAGDFRVWDAPEGPEVGIGELQTPLVRGWASLDPHEPRRLLVTPDTELACWGIVPRNLVTGLDPHTLFAAAQINRRRVVERVSARARARHWERVSLTAMGPPAGPRVDDCGARGHDSAATSLVGEEAPTLEPITAAPFVARPIPAGVLSCAAPWVCERCWASVATGQGSVAPERAGFELARILGNIHDLWIEDGWPGHVPHRRSAGLLAGPGRVRIRPARGFVEGEGWIPTTLEVEHGDTVDAWPLSDSDRLLVGDDDVLDERVLVLRHGDYTRLELSDPPMESGAHGAMIRAAAGQRLGWSDPAVREFDYFGVTGKPFGYAVASSFGRGWTVRVHDHDEWRLLLGEDARPTELFAPFAGHLRIRRLDDGRYEFRITAPATEDRPAREWTGHSTTYCPSPYSLVQDDIDVPEGQHLADGYLDPHEYAARDADGSRWWVLEVMLLLSLHARVCVDWRALELYARISTSPRGSFVSMNDLARARADRVTQMRLGSMFEELRAAVLAN